MKKYGYEGCAEGDGGVHERYRAGAKKGGNEGCVDAVSRGGGDATTGENVVMKLALMKDATKPRGIPYDFGFSIESLLG